MKYILIVDDHPLIRMGLESIVQKVIKNCVIRHAGTFQEANDQMQLQKMDLIILDLSIPGSNGLAMIPHFRKSYPEVHILICSARDELSNAAQCISMGANGFLPKSATDEESETAVKTVMENKRYLRQQVQQQMLENLINKKSVMINPLESLTRREKQIFELLILGKWTKEIAETLNLKFSTVSTHKTRILEKMDVQNVVELYKKVGQHASEV